MEDLFKILDNMISQNNQNQPRREFDYTNIKIGVKYLEDGFVVKEYKPIPNSYKLNVVFINDNGDEEVIKMSLNEQIIWINLLENKGRRGNVKFI